ncbi:MAG: hypothetical protein JWN70_4473 [Planctomycetaceae bacterium]|nr:hypothetical protein [Planctomycetaceae bacterium]
MSVYPRAIKANFVFSLFLGFARDVLGITEKNIAFAASICSDDINSIELPLTKMIGPFVLGGLDGFPFVGQTGIEAFSHHVPDEGMAFIFFGPHVGVGDGGEVGTIKRPGMASRTACCGSASAALEHVIAGSDPCYDPELDFQQKAIFDILKAHAPELKLLAMPARFVRATELIYDASHDRMRELLKHLDLQGKMAVVAGGTLINEDDAKGSLISLNSLSTYGFKSFGRFDGSKAEGTVNLMSDFKHYAKNELLNVLAAIEPVSDRG